MKTTTKTIFIIVTFLTLVCVGGYAYVTQYVSGLTQKTTEVKDQIDQLEAELGHLQALHNAAQNSSDEKAKINSFVIQPGESVNFITKLEQLAGSRGLVYSTDRIETKGSIDLDLYQKELLQVSFMVFGEWSEVYRFIKLTESLPYAITIERVELTTTKSDFSNVANVRSVSTSTKNIKSGENLWKMNILFDVVKTKDNQ